MKIKTRLAFQFTTTLSLFLIGFSVLIYYFWLNSQQSKYREYLLRRAKNTGIMYFSIPELELDVLRIIQNRTFTWTREEIVIADSTANIIYSNTPNYLSSEFIRDFQGLSEIQYFKINEKDGVRYTLHVDKKKYFIYVMAHDWLREENLKQLKIILSWGILIGFILSILMAYFFALRALIPLTRLVSNVNKINNDKLNFRLPIKKENDEIGELGSAINKMLDKLDNASRNQRTFVTNASHELRTPLSVLIAEAGFLIKHKHDPEKYVEHIKKMINDLKGINDLTDSLLVLSRVMEDSEIIFSEVLVNEILYKVISGLKLKYPENKIILKIDYPKNDIKLKVSGNADLLELAFRNIIDNACKFSRDEILVEINHNESEIIVIVTDKGIGIPEQELGNILHPFSRASNARTENGYGIGLSIVKRIVDLHMGELRIESNIQKGTIVRLILKQSCK